jgi:serine/alanine adding enzyme
MEILINENIPIHAWEELLNHSPHSTPFQSYKFYNLLNATKGQSAQAIAISESEKLLALVVITFQQEPGVKNFFSRRAIIYGGPLIVNKNPETLHLLFSILPKVINKSVIYYEIRNFSDYSNYQQVYLSCNWQFIYRLNITLNLKNKKTSSLLASMNYNRRREIRISIESGAFFKECESESELIDLYIILSELYKIRVKLPVPDYTFFKSLWLSKIGKVFIVKHADIVIGGSFCLVLAGKSIFTMYYCGIRDYNKKIFPTHLAILAAIEYGINSKIQYLDFMGAGKDGEDYGVRKYKQQFGGEINEFGRYIKVQNQFLYSLGKLVLDIKRKF